MINYQSKPSSMKGLKSLYWFTHDLRIDDNPILHHACNSDQLLCVYCVDPRWFSAKRYHLAQMGALRWQFLQQNLEDLASQLAAYGQQLHIIHATAEQAIVQLCQHFQIDQKDLHTLRSPLRCLNVV